MATIERRLDAVEKAQAGAVGQTAWQPLPGPQTLAYESLADVVGYGGAAGGGKTDLAIGLALTRHQRVQIIRRYSTELTALIDRVVEVVGHRDGLNQVAGIWRMGHRTLEFGSVPNPGDERRYQGRAKDLLIVDESANVAEAAFRFLSGWVRSTDPLQRCRTLLCFNPPTSAEGRWVVKYFAPWLDRTHPNPAAPGELRWFAVLDGQETEVEDGEPFLHGDELVQPSSRTFVPARLADNPHLSGTNYMATLQALPEPLRSQLLHGDFAAGMEDDPWQVVPTAWVEAAQARWVKPAKLPRMVALGVDVARGGKDWTVIARRHVGHWYDEMAAHAGASTPDGPAVAGLTMAAMRNRCSIYLDVIGVGSAPYDFLRQADLPVHGINVAERATRTDRSGRLTFRNLRSQLWWNLRELLDPANNVGMCLPPDPQLLADLTAPRWNLSSSTVAVESRDDIVKRIGRSPDRASALILAAMADEEDLQAIEGALMLAGDEDVLLRRYGRVPGRNKASATARDYDPLAYMNK